MEPPTNVKEVHSFVSSPNYYLMFVAHFAEIATPLRVMLKKVAVFNWTDECQHAFEEQKREIASKRVLAHFNVKCPTIVSTDA